MRYTIIILAFIVGCDSNKPVKITDTPEPTPQATSTKLTPNTPPEPAEEPRYKPSKLLPEESLGDFNFGWIGKTLTKKETLPKCKKGWKSKDYTSEEGPFRGLKIGVWSCLKMKAYGSTTGVNIFTQNDQIGIVELKGFSPKNKVYKKIPLMTCQRKKVVVSDKKAIQADFDENTYVGQCGDATLMLGHIKDRVDILFLDKTQYATNSLLNAMRESLKTPDYDTPLVLGDFEYKVMGANLTTQLGTNRFLREKATKGGTFVTIKYSIQNKDNKTRTVLTGDLLLKDAKGRQFRASSKATKALVMENKAQMFVQELQPGLPVEQYIAFEVPLDSVEKRSKLKLIIPEKGALGSKQITFDLWFNN